MFTLGMIENILLFFFKTDLGRSTYRKIAITKAGTIGHKFSVKKTELIIRPVFALISQALQNTEYIARVTYIDLFVY